MLAQIFVAANSFANPLAKSSTTDAVVLDIKVVIRVCKDINNKKTTAGADLHPVASASSLAFFFLVRKNHWHLD